MNNFYFGNSQINNQIAKTRILSKEEEISLAKEAEMGNVEAREALINNNLKLVVSIARKYTNLGLDLDDLFAFGCNGLIKAVDSFDFRKGYRLSTLASISITNEVIDGLNNFSRTIRIPAQKLNVLKRINDISGKYIQEYGKEPSVDYIAEELKMSKRKVFELLEVSREMVSFDQTINESVSYVDTISDKGPENKNDRACASLKRLVSKCASTLPKKEKELMSLRFGLDGNEEMTVYKVAQETGVSQTIIRRIEEKLVKQVRNLEEFQSLKFCA